MESVCTTRPPDSRAICVASSHPEPPIPISNVLPFAIGTLCSPAVDEIERTREPLRQVLGIAVLDKAIGGGAGKWLCHDHTIRPKHEPVSTPTLSIPASRCRNIARTQPRRATP